MKGFYRVPKYIYNPIGESEEIKGSVLIPFDPEGELANQVRSFGIENITVNDDLDNLSDVAWWAENKDHDWIIAITQGNKELLELITSWGIISAKSGICILDRISFLEPTRRRENFLTTTSLTNIKILSPRPAFRADGRTTKDSVTSAWFIFRPAGAALTSTQIDFSVSWQRPQKLKL